MKLSARGRRWELILVDENYKSLIIQKYYLKDYIAHLLANRVDNIQNIENFLSPRIKNSLPNPLTFKDMEVAVKRISKAIDNKEKIAIFGDYDVDGATSSSLLWLFFKYIGLDVITYIPDRIIEGYGPNVNAFKKLKSLGISLIITVDCGILSFEPISWAKKNNLDIIVTDHHLADKETPEAIAIINPNRYDESKEFSYLAGVGVAFLLVVAINSYLKSAKFYEQNLLKEPNLIMYLDLVALGTVCDIMPLIGLNRVFVSQGLKVMNKTLIKGLREIKNLDNIEKFATYDLGFKIGPKINAGGRIGESSLGFKLLTVDKDSDVKIIAQKLVDLNIERKVIELNALDSSIKKIESEELYKRSIIMVGDSNWHPGIIGIVASRVKDKYNLPSIILSIDSEKGISKASCRSISGINIGDFIAKAKKEKLLLKEGGIIWRLVSL